MNTIDRIFLNYKHDILYRLGNAATSDKQINEAGEQLFKSKWRGCFSWDDFNFNSITPNTYYVLNTGNRRSPGYHWVGLYIGAGKTLYVYDSFGRKTKLILRVFTDRVRNHGYKIVESNPDKEQHVGSSVCGVLSLAWLCFVKHNGISQALKI